MNGRPSSEKQRRTPRAPALAGSVRTCIGCGAHDAREATVRLCLDENGGPTLARRGRGARLHPRAKCVSGAARRGLSRSFRREVRSTPLALATLLVDDAVAAATQAIARAARTGAITTDEATIDGGFVVVAVDAGETTQHPVIAGAIAGGRAVALLSRRELGALVQRDQAPVVVIHHARLASVVRDACATIDALRFTVSEVG